MCYNNTMSDNKAKLIYINLPHFSNIKSTDEWDGDEVEAKVIKFLNNNKQFIPKEAIRGDVLKIAKIGDFNISEYRNDGRVIFDGEKIIRLCSDIDDYGSIPKNFLTFEEFPIGYFTNVIEHNTIHFIDLSKFETSVRKTYNEYYDKLYVIEFVHQDKQYTIVSSKKLKNTIVSVELEHDDIEGYDFVSTDIRF